MKFKEFSGQSAPELRKKMNDIRGQIFEAKMKNSMGQLQSPMSIRNLRRDIAKIFTALKAGAPAKAAVKAKAPAKAQEKARTAAAPKGKTAAKTKKSK